MLGALYIGISGLDAYSKALQVISNNVANLDTAGFKSQTVTFNDIFENGGNGLTYTGGSNSSDVGAGVTLNNPGIDFTQGTMQQTTGSLDLAIQGEGFLVLQNNGQTVYGRTGSFSVDSQGYISEQNTGYHLTVLNGSNQPVAVNIQNQQTNPPVATTTIDLNQNLSSSATTASVSNVTVFDSNGGAHTWTINLTASSTTTGSWTVSVKDETGATVGSGTIAFTGGAINSASSKITASATYSGASALSVALDFANVTNFSSGTTSTIATSSVDGNAAGTLSSVTIDNTGQVLLTYSNQKTVKMGAVAIADFRNPQQLTQASGGTFQNTKGASVQYFGSAQSGVGTLVSKQIEASNVDLSQEFGDLILIQRGFQASSEVITTTNDMIQQLFGMRGQG